jgi:hypothetical protein
MLVAVEIPQGVWDAYGVRPGQRAQTGQKGAIQNPARYADRCDSPVTNEEFAGGLLIR